MKEVVKILQSKANNTGKYGYEIFEAFLDFLLDMFDYSHFIDGNWEEYLEELRKREPEFLTCALGWIVRVTEKIERYENWDGLGLIYEELYQSKGKASSLGQFFTPDCLCDVMSKIARGDEDSDNLKPRRVNDCACGSGRTLLAARVREMEQHRNQDYYFGEDIDGISVKMCALNLMIYGCRGAVTRMDSLKYTGTWDCYVLNEVRYPIPTQYYCIRKTTRVIEPPQSQKPTIKQKSTPVQLTLF